MKHANPSPNSLPGRAVAVLRDLDGRELTTAELARQLDADPRILIKALATWEERGLLERRKVGKGKTCPVMWRFGGGSVHPEPDPAPAERTDEELREGFPTQRIVPAAEAAPINTKAPRSVFDIGHTPQGANRGAPTGQSHGAGSVQERDGRGNNVAPAPAAAPASIPRPRDVAAYVAAIDARLAEPTPDLPTVREADRVAIWSTGEMAIECGREVFVFTAEKARGVIEFFQRIGRAWA